MSFSSKKYIWGVRIELNHSVTQNTDIGLYLVSGKGEFRWIQSQCTTTLAYKDGILLEGGISPISQEGDFSIGGNVAQVKGCSVAISSVIDELPLWKILDTASINFLGKKLQVIEFDYSTSPATETILYTFVIDNMPVWNEGEYRIEAVAAYYKRNAFLGTLVDNSVNGNYPDASEDSNGEMIPISIGQIAPILGSDGNIEKTIYASGLCVDNKNDNIILFYDNNVKADRIAYVVYSSVEDGFGWTGSSFDILINYKNESGVEYNIDTTDMFLVVINDPLHNENNGLCRRIINSYFSSGSSSGRYLTIDADGYYPNVIPAQGTWVKIMRFSKTVYFDYWKCIGFTNKNLELLLKTPELYIYKDNIYYQLPSETFEINNDTYNNNLLLNKSRIADNFQEIEYQSIISASRIEPLDKINPLGSIPGTITKNIGNGFYLFYLTSTTGFLYDTKILYSRNASYAIDKDGDTSFETSIECYYPTARNNPISRYFILSIYPPEIKDEFDSVSLGIDASIALNVLTPTIDQHLLLSKIEIEYWTPIVTPTVITGYDFGTTVTNKSVTILNLPEWFYDNNGVDNNFWNIRNYSTYALMSGVDNEHLVLTGINSLDKYRTIRRINVYFANYELSAYPGNFTLTYKINEAAFIFKKTASINNNIYSPFKGRVFNDTWGSRKTATSLIESPIDILEHALRLQNWSDVDADINIGHEYAPNAKIKTGSDEGSFDYLGLDEVRYAKVSRQILDESEGWSGAIIESICKEFDLCSYQDNEGNECVNSVQKFYADPLVSIDLSQIKPDSISDFEEVSAQDIYCEPYVKYAWNPATEKYDGIIRVTNSSADTFDASYVSGYTGTAAEEIWNMAHALYLRYGIVTPPPSEFAELKWISNITDAKNRLYAKLKYMGAYLDTNGNNKAAARKRFSFVIPYSLATDVNGTHKPWFVSMKFLITLPHQTYNAAVQCMVEGVTLDANNFEAEIKCVSYDVTDEIQFFIQDSYNSYESVGSPDIQDTYLTKTEQSSNANDVDDTY